MIITLECQICTWKVLGDAHHFSPLSVTTLSVKRKLITSSECLSLKSKASTRIIFGHRLGKLILNKHFKKKV